MSDKIQKPNFPINKIFGTNTENTGQSTIQLSSAVQRRGIIFIGGKDLYILYVTGETAMSCVKMDGTPTTVIANGNYNFTITDLSWWSTTYAIIV